MEQELYFEKDDKLGRKRYAEFLKNLILNSSVFKREDERKAFSIAIDSPWGTGKSYFLNMLKNHLRGLSSDESEFDTNGPFRVVLYNAWENDCWNNAFEPLAQKLCESSDIGDLLPENKESLKEAVKSIRIVLQGMGEKAVENMISDNAINELRQCAAKVYDPYLNVSEEYVKFRQSVDMLKHILSESAKELQQRSGDTHAKIVVIIDELDRCRPDFAVQTMEFVKHLFDAENVVFLFALDMSQLCHSVKSIYGEGMDAEGYLIRFFDYYGRMTKPDLLTFVQHILQPDVPDFNFYLPEEFLPKAVNIIQRFNLSLRDIKTVLRVYIQMNVCVLKQYKLQYAHEFYLMMLCIKYKRPGDYAKLVSSQKPSNEIWSLLPKSVQDLFIQDEKLNCVVKDVLNREGKLVCRVRQMKCSEDNENNKNRFYIVYKINSMQYRRYEIDETDSVNNFLFYPDLKKWDQIKDLTPAQYLMQQLEMFDFFHPQDQ